MATAPPPAADAAQALDFVAALVTRLGEEAARRQGSAVEQRKPAAALTGSVVTDVDLETERAVDDALRERFPADGLIGEEGADRPPADPEHGRTWVVDPIDGTLNYARRLGPWSVVVSAWRGPRERPQPESVAVWTGGHLYTALAGHGAFVRVGGPQAEPRRLHLEGAAEPGGVVRAGAGVVGAVKEAGWLAKVVESSAAEVASIADGRVMGTLRLGGDRRDLHGPALLVAEAGGAVVPLDGEPLSGVSRSLVLAHPGAADDLVALATANLPVTGPAD
ncbi:inositol monophosphatase family protein [Quadrisphaera sp. KR29]|uniref:inositol monophosphatase family protein n=1 Tax=Quadrisphaera sp. KR29 TaxID=3461391 RepID=UPI0040443AA7